MPKLAESDVLDLSQPQGAPLPCVCARPTLASETHRGQAYYRCTTCAGVRADAFCHCAVTVAGLASYDRHSGRHTCVACGLERRVARAAQQPQAPVEPQALQVDHAAIERAWVAGEAVRSATCGYLVGWSGAGELDLATVNMIATGHNLPVVEPKSNRALLGAAVAAHTTRLVRSVAEGRRGVFSIVELTQVGAVGESAGERKARIVLQADGSVVTEGSTPALGRILATYADMRASQKLAAGEVTTWIETCIVSIGGVRSGANWYLHNGAFARFQPVIAALQTLKWGSGWLRGLPMIKSDCLAESIIDGLERDLAAITYSLDAQRTVAAERGAKVGTRAVSNALESVKAIAARGYHYAGLFGEQYASNLRAKCAEVISGLSDLCDDAVQRFDLIYDEISRSDA